jgi:hypothetical protein
MAMQYPNARLFIHSLLSDHRVSGSEAIVQCAYEYGLVPAGSIKPLVESDKLPCQCMAALKNVLIKYLDAKQPQSPIYDLEEIWTAVERDVEAYRERSTPLRQRDHPAHFPECKKLAPALFDILLQQIHRYP